MANINKIRRKKVPSLNEAIDNEIKSNRIDRAKDKAKQILESKKNNAGKKVLNERAEMNVKKIDTIELNELLASLKENIEYDLNDDLNYFRVITGLEGDKAYIDLEARDDVDFFDGFSVDDILYINNPAEYDIDKREFEALKDNILKEKETIEKRFIPKIARDWGFRVMKESLTEAADVAMVDDLLAANLFRDYQHGILKNLPLTKYYDESGDEVTNNHYNTDNQIGYDWEDGFADYYFYLIDEKDAALAKAVFDKLKLGELADKNGVVGRVGFVTFKRPLNGYKYIYRMRVPQEVIDTPLGEFFAKIDADPSDYKNGERVEMLKRNGEKRLARKG